MVIGASSLRAELTTFLETHGIPDAAFDVRCMMEQVTGKRLETLMTHGIESEDENPIRNMVQRRACGEPLQYILGEWEFYGMRMYVGKGVLIPRPDTETLVDAVLGRCRDNVPLRILDICTGSGCIALALKARLPCAEVHGMDISADALAYARKNAACHGLEIIWHQADALQQYPDMGQFDVIVSNPPYLSDAEMQTLQTEIQHEPAIALAGGKDGLHFYRKLTRCWKRAVRPSGLLAYEIGETQAEAVQSFMEDAGFRNIRTLQDAANHDRVVLGEK